MTAINHLTPIQRLPRILTGERIELRMVTADAWPQIKKVKPDDLDNLALNITASQNKTKYFKDRSQFIWLCDTIRDADMTGHYAKYLSRSYLIHNRDQENIVGVMYVTNLPPDEKNAYIIGYATFADHRKKGYMNEAINLFSDTVLDSGVASTICALTFAGNDASENLLRKTGFQQIADEVCTSNPLGALHHFVKAKTPTNHWPTPHYL